MGSGPASAALWRFLVDENLPRSLVPDLQALGYAAEHVYDLGMGGAKDPSVYAYAQAHQETVLTGDKDFSDIRAYPHRTLASSSWKCLIPCRQMLASASSLADWPRWRVSHSRIASSLSR